MNQPYPQFPQPPGYPQQQPQTPYPQQPMMPQYPQQPMMPQYPQQPMGMPPQAVAQAAAGGLFNQFLTEPPRKRADRKKPNDGTYVVQFTQNCKVDFSQKDARVFLLLEYRVIEGTVPQMQGQTFSTVMFWSNRMQLQDLADLAKYVFGAQLPQIAQNSQGNPQIMAQYIAQTVAQGCFAGLRVQRSPKQLQTVGYEQAFANHYWQCVTPPNQPITLAQLGASAPPAPAMPPQPGGGFLPQQPPGQAMMPQPPQPAFSAPQPMMQQPMPMAPQQPFPAPPSPGPAPSLPQAAPALPQAAPASPPPAYYVPPAGGLPQR